MRFAACDPVPVVIPVAIVTVHSIFRASIEVAEVSVKVAVEVPELAEVTLNVVVPQPLDVGVDMVPNVNVGITTMILSDTARCTFSENVIETEDAVATIGRERVNAEFITLGYSRAEDIPIGVASTFVSAAISTAIVRMAVLLA
jgi:hypothetical protein